MASCRNNAPQQDPITTGRFAVLQQAEDFRRECEVLYAALDGVSDADMARPTQFKQWTTDDVLGHLHLFDV
ncbi:MAG: maleylpyruvate isomerase N-terminal domain-containing protein, partial [Parahaliea sp.]